MKTRFVLLSALVLILSSCQQKDPQLSLLFGSPATASQWEEIDITSTPWLVVDTYMKNKDGVYTNDLLSGTVAYIHYTFSTSGKCVVETKLIDGTRLQDTPDWSYKSSFSILSIGDDSYEVRISVDNDLFLVDQSQPLVYQLAPRP